METWSSAAAINGPFRPRPSPTATTEKLQQPEPVHQRPPKSYPHPLPGSLSVRRAQEPFKYPEDEGPRPPSWRMDLHMGQG